MVYPMHKHWLSLTFSPLAPSQDLCVLMYSTATPQHTSTKCKKNHTAIHTFQRSSHITSIANRFMLKGNYKSTRHVRCIFCDGYVWTILAFIFVKCKQNIQCSSPIIPPYPHTHTHAHKQTTPAEKSTHSLCESS